MNTRRLICAAGALAVLATMAWAGPARAEHDGWRERRHEWREHEWREHEWREHHAWYRPYYCPPRRYEGYGW